MILLPTPKARDSQDEGLEAGRRRMERYSTSSLSTRVQTTQQPLGALLPTPTVGDSASARNSTATRHKIPPTGIHAGNTLTDLLVPLPGETTSLLSAAGNASLDDPPPDLLSLLATDND